MTVAAVLCAVLCAASAVIAGPQAPASGVTHGSPTSSLLRNGGFERDAGWTIGQYTVLDSVEPRTGKRCLRADGARGAAAEQTVWAVKPGAAYTVCGWMRTRDVVGQEGGFAFMALYEHDSAGRIVRFTDFAKVTGTTAWSVHTHTVRLAPSTEYVVVKAGIHSALGTAWFDDLNLVEGAGAAAWREPAARPSRAGDGFAYRAAILDDPSLPVVGAGTPAATFRKAFAAEGVSLRSLSADRVIAGDLNADAYDLFVIPTGATFPVEARKPLLAFLMAGGDLLCTGGYAFDHLVVRAGAKWEPYRRYLDRANREARGRPIPNGGFEDGAPSGVPEGPVTGWVAEGPACAVDETAAASGRRSGRVVIGATGPSGRWTAQLGVEPGRSYLIGASVKIDNVHGSHYAYLAVYQFDENGKLLEFKDFAQMTGSHDWKRRESRIVINPSARRVLFHAGMYLAAGTLWVDDVTCAPLPVEERINAHFGEPMDGLVLSPVQLTLFSPDQRFAAARGVGVWPGRPAVRLDGELRGYDATAQLRQSARWQPLVEGRDRFGRISGAVGSLVTHHTGPFSGSRWALYGVTNRDVFAGSQGMALLRHTARLLSERVAARSFAADMAMYGPGETVRLSLGLHSPRGSASAIGPLRVSLALDAPGRSGRARTLPSRSRTLPRGSAIAGALEWTWKVPPNAPDFVRARAVISDPSGRVLDAIETGFCVRDAKVVASGTHIRYRDNAFTLQRPGKPPTRTTLFGTDTYGNMLLSPSCGPLTWFRDLQAMRDHGLHMYENLQYPPTGWKYTEAEWRKLDALIQLSQRFGLPYMAGLLIGVDVAVDDATLQAQAAMCRSFAERYRDVPGLIYYLNGDFRLEMKDTPDLRRLWNDMLRERYGSDAALRSAWGPEAVSEALGDIPVADFVTARAFSERARDVKLFQAFLVRRWVSALTSAIREADPSHPITSEYYQRPYSGIDLRLSMDEMDAANIGYFGPPREDIAQLLATIKWNDMRRSGQTVNLGEFGVKTHDAWAQERDPFGYHIGRTEEEQRRQLWWVVHAALAYDVTKIQNWCWADDPDGVFPWGVAYNNPLRPKPVLRLWRNLRFVSEQIAHAYEPAPVVLVMPDSWRLGAPEPAGWRWVMNAIECLLATNARFDVVNESAIATLGRRVRLVIAPFASCLPKAAQESLVRLAHDGAVVYVSSPPAEGPIASTGSATGAGPRLERRSVGAGALVVSQDAWEAFPAEDVFVRAPEATADPERNRYLGLLAMAGVEADARVEARSGVWRATARSADDRTVIALFARSNDQAAVPVTVRTAASVGSATGGHVVVWSAASDWPCLVVLDSAGGVLAATGSGTLTVGGRRVVSGQGPWMVAALDGKPLDRSRRLVVGASLGSAAGDRLTLATDAARCTARVVEFDGSALRPVGAASAVCRRGAMTITVPANELVLIERAGQPGP